jgi:hypothetical protein
MERDVMLSTEEIRRKIIRKEDHGNSSGDHKFVLLVDSFDHDDTVTADDY